MLWNILVSYSPEWILHLVLSSSRHDAKLVSLECTSRQQQFCWWCKAAMGKVNCFRVRMGWPLKVRTSLYFLLTEHDWKNNDFSHLSFGGDILTWLWRWGCWLRRGWRSLRQIERLKFACCRWPGSWGLLGLSRLWPSCWTAVCARIYQLRVQSIWGGFLPPTFGGSMWWDAHEKALGRLMRHKLVTQHAVVCGTRGCRLDRRWRRGRGGGGRGVQCTSG